MDDAARQALAAVQSARTLVREVRFVLFTADALATFESALADVR
jgi:O-acetyl-ADP-ribose deacetylase (regulator of RNase III)